MQNRAKRNKGLLKNESQSISLSNHAEEFKADLQTNILDQRLNQSRDRVSPSPGHAPRGCLLTWQILPFAARAPTTCAGRGYGPAQSRTHCHLQASRSKLPLRPRSFHKPADHGKPPETGNPPHNNGTSWHGKNRAGGHASPAPGRYPPSIKIPSPAISCGGTHIEELLLLHLG